MQDLSNPATGIIFLGDSLTQAFDLEYHFPGRQLVNRGLSGDTTFDVIYRLEDIVNAKPAKLFLMIGINDLFNAEDEVITFDNIVRILGQFRQYSPDTLLFLQSILPVNESVMFSDENINLLIFSLNDSLMKYCKDEKITFIDLYLHFLNDHGELDGKYTYDGVHLSPEGYELWADLVRLMVIDG
jgi:lysophospholipase L1-like esterase